MLKTLRKLTTTGARFEWDIVYVENGKIKSLYVSGSDEDVLKTRLQGFTTPSRSLLLVLRLRDTFLKRKYRAELQQLLPIKSLSLRHNVNVFLRNSYANGEEVCKEVDAQHNAEERQERLRTYAIKNRPRDLWLVLKEIKNNIAIKPVLLAFSSANRGWEQQRDFYVSGLVDYEQQLVVMEIQYDPQAKDKLAIQDIFIRFKVRRVPAWIMATPVKKGGKASIRVDRFDTYRDAYFAQQKSQGRRDMDAQKQEDVEEAFVSFLLWGLKQVASLNPRESISL